MREVSVLHGNILIRAEFFLCAWRKMCKTALLFGYWRHFGSVCCTFDLLLSNVMLQRKEMLDIAHTSLH